MKVGPQKYYLKSLIHYISAHYVRVTWTVNGYILYVSSVANI